MADGSDETVPMLEQAEATAESAPEPAPQLAEEPKPEISTDAGVDTPAPEDSALDPENGPTSDSALDPENGPTSDTEGSEVTNTETVQADEVVLRENGGANTNVSGSAPIRPPRSSQSLPLPSPVDKPVKPPRLKSMRSKEGSPLLRSTEEPRDVEASVTVITGPTGDNNAIDTKPYEATTEPLPEKQDAVQSKKKCGLDDILSKKWIILGIIGVILVILILVIVGVSISRGRFTEVPVKTYSDPVVVGLKCGEAVGSWELNHTVAVFRGIPYLRAPVGERRWSYELEHKHASDCDNSTEAKEFKGPCFQTNPDMANDTPYIGSEDCLYLNIWTPGLSADDPVAKKNLSVLVYIHGGLLHYGSGHRDLFSPSAQLAQEMNAVIVSFNYRLNVFGWLAIQERSSDSTGISGNFGLYDQMQALKWVRDYISNFGGNPNLVTVAGISSGGTSILALLTNAKARLTFQRVWISGASSKFDGDKQGTFDNNTKVYLRNVGCKDSANVMQCLLEKTSEELMEAIPWKQYPSWAAMDLVVPPTKGLLIGAVLINDGEYVKKSPQSYLKATATGIPLLMGNDEFETDRYQEVPVDRWTWGQYSDYIRSKLDTFNTSLSDYVLNDYAPKLKNNTRLHMSRHVSDMRSICPQTFLADGIVNVSDNAPLYRYVMTATTPQELSDEYLGGSAVATHATDFAMFFHYSDDDNKRYKATKERFRKIIKNFMVTGNVTDWEPFPSVYTIGSEATALTKQWTVEACETWKEYYPEYSWMN